jgi:hypothetical protein
MPGDERSDRDSPNPRPVRRDRDMPVQSDEDVDTPESQRRDREDRDEMS